MSAIKMLSNYSAKKIDRLISSIIGGESGEEFDGALSKLIAS